MGCSITTDEISHESFSRSETQNLNFRLAHPAGSIFFSVFNLYCLPPTPVSSSLQDVYSSYSLQCCTTTPQAPHHRLTQVSQPELPVLYQYNGRAPSYDASTGGWQPGTFSYLDFVDRIAPALGASVLVLACGTGLVTILAAKTVGSSGTVIGIDITPGMLREA
jgi:hypothetical protein